MTTTPGMTPHERASQAQTRVEAALLGPGPLYDALEELVTAAEGQALDAFGIHGEERRAAIAAGDWSVDHELLRSEVAWLIAERLFMVALNCQPAIPPTPDELAALDGLRALRRDGFFDS